MIARLTISTGRHDQHGIPRGRSGGTDDAPESRNVATSSDTMHGAVVISNASITRSPISQAPIRLLNAIGDNPVSTPHVAAIAMDARCPGLASQNPTFL